MRTAIPSVLVATALVCSLSVIPAYAARDRVFVASFGTDTGNTTCSFTQPCRTFQTAVNNVALGGEVTAIDSAGFGPISITQAVTITSPNGVEAGIVATGPSAISITAGSGDTVTLRGLTLDGVATTNTGISFSSGGRLEIIDCTVRNFTSFGISVQPTTAASVLISNTLVTDVSANGAAAIDFSPQGSSLAITAALDHVTAGHNNIGVVANALNGPVELVISKSYFGNANSNEIVLAGGVGSNAATAFFKDVILNQDPIAILLAGNATAYLSQVTQTVAPGFPSSAGINEAGANNAVFGDGTNHFQGTVPATGTWSSF
jgi:hypothetical protein